MMPSEHPIREAFRASIRHALGPSQVVEFSDGILALDAAGKIAACGPYEKLEPQLPKDCVLRDYRGSWLIPGFVDCHAHWPQLDCRNKNGLTLLDWLAKYIYPAEAQFADSKKVPATASRFFNELLFHGITTAAVYSTIHYEATDIAFQIALDKGLRVVMGQVLMDQNAPVSLLKPLRQLLTETGKLIEKWHGRDGKIFYAVTPRFALTCSKNLIDEAGRMASDAKVYFQTHLAETSEEVKQVRDLYHFKNYPAFFGERNCLGRHSILAHCIYLQDEEWRILSELRCAVAHCPTSNVFLKSGTMPAAVVEKNGVRYGFGSDVGAGPTFSMREIGDCALQIHPKSVMTSEKAFYLATLGGAEVLSLANQVGNFVEGKWGDFSIFESSDFSGTAKAVFVAGKPVFENV